MTTEAKVAWITGGISGLGVQVARVLAEAGYRIAVNYRSSLDAAEKLKGEVEERGGQLLALQGDVSQVEDVRRMAGVIHDCWERVDVLVCAAGPLLFQRIETIAFTDDQWREMVDGNLSGVFYCVREVVPGMRRRGWGRIVTFGFPEVETAPAWTGFSAYAAAKAGVVSLTRTLAQEEAPHGITVNMVSPGDIRHPFKEAPIAAARGKQEPRNPVGRPGTGEDLARVIRFLAEPNSDFITGAVVPVTGGFDNRDFRVDHRE
ncbi:SDR family oxidoreductase [Desmospora profundinema]|uniref:3-oxoacyl-[acyl-carrier protein] reductase n=1 Tax=Desmospora profundinema TaxID=1571184 RepID=A0ABU1INC6_9BACL|nr:SDR family oxidoreductase [Desmospora profundinema]MDR6225903.1 3-oxoacyl-[acyl-carrier protein] reductase [Desmospora profundinema]